MIAAFALAVFVAGLAWTGTLRIRQARREQLRSLQERGSGAMTRAEKSKQAEENFR